MPTLTSRTRARRRSREESHAMVQTLVAMGLLCVTTLALLAAPVPTGKPGNYPAWWFSRNVIAQKNPTNASPAWPTNYPTSDDYSGINQGQLKNMATAAYNELVAQAPTNVWSTPQGTNLTAMVTGWSNTGNNYLATSNELSIVKLHPVKCTFFISDQKASKEYKIESSSRQLTETSGK